MKILRHLNSDIMPNLKAAYDDQMDLQCVDLCDAINSVPYLKTFESCCGHGKRPMCIWFVAQKIDWLYFVARAKNRFYGGPVTHDGNAWKEWEISVLDRDYGLGVAFLLQSMSKGNTAYRQAIKIAKNIRLCLDNAEFMRSWRRTRIKHNAEFGWDEKT